MTVIAVDVGYSAVKGIAGAERVLFPSLVGTPVPESRFSIKRNQRALAVTGNGHYVPVGDTALLQSRYAAGRKDPEWVLGAEWLTLFQCALSELVTTPFARISLVTGLPVGDWNAFNDQLYDRLAHQTFAFRRIGRDKQRVEVENVIVVTQPYGALLDMALDGSGKILDDVWSNRRVGIVDIGGNTLNLLTVQAFEEVTQLTTSDTFGLLRALDGVRDSLKANFKRFDPDTHEVSEWLVSGLFRQGGKEHQLWPYAEPFLAPLIDLVLTKIYDTWPEAGRFDALLLSGGGAAILGQRLQERMRGEFANVAIAADPRWANVRGYYKLALREFGGG